MGTNSRIGSSSESLNSLLVDIFIVALLPCHRTSLYLWPFWNPFFPFLQPPLLNSLASIGLGLGSFSESSWKAASPWWLFICQPGFLPASHPQSLHSLAFLLTLFFTIFINIYYYNFVIGSIIVALLSIKVASTSIIVALLNYYWF